MGATKFHLQIDHVDGNDRVVGAGPRRDVFSIRAGFRVVHLLLFNDAGELLLQKVASGLRSAGSWGSSVAGYIETQETYDEAVVRKLREELHLDGTVAPTPSPLEVATAVRGRPVMTRVGKTRMLDSGCVKFISVYETVWNGLVGMEPADATGMEFLSPAEIDAAQAAGTRSFTPTFLRVWDFYRSVRP